MQVLSDMPSYNPKTLTYLPLVNFRNSFCANFLLPKNYKPKL